jgi:hypothetical protein
MRNVKNEEKESVLRKVMAIGNLWVTNLVIIVGIVLYLY